MPSRSRTPLAALVAALLITAFVSSAAAWQPATTAFQHTWERTDRPVADGSVERTWLWGPAPVSGILQEDYANATGGTRTVQYFDKSRMEINDPDGDQSSPWYVTNGLLVVELAAGRLQLGDTTFEQRAPANLRVAGDEDGVAPTYATIGALMASPAYQLGHVITERLAADTTVVTDPSLAGLDVTAYYYVSETRHTVAEPFWYFLTSTQPVYEDGQIVSDALFEHPFYATGLPITEAYWIHTSLNGYETDILLQCFERRCLTYTPTNAAGWQVESGNVGRHYYQWRYGVAPEQNAVVTTIATGPDTLEYRFKGNPPLESVDDGPYTLSVAPDGSFWISDLTDTRLLQFDRDGRRIGAIDLTPYHAVQIWDMEARTGAIWVFWSNLDLGITKIQAFAPDGTLLRTLDVDPSIVEDAIETARDIAVTDNDEVILQMDLGLRYVRVVDAQGNADATPVDTMTFDGHTYRLEGTLEDWTTKTIVVDGRPIAVTADAGAAVLSLSLLPDPASDTFFIRRTSVFNDGSFHWAVERRRIDGTLLGVGSEAEEGERYAYVPNPFSVGPDGNLYKLMAYRDHVEILRIGFATP